MASFAGYLGEGRKCVYIYICVCVYLCVSFIFILTTTTPHPIPSTTFTTGFTARGHRNIPQVSICLYIRVSPPLYLFLSLLSLALTLLPLAYNCYYSYTYCRYETSSRSFKSLPVKSLGSTVDGVCVELTRLKSVLASLSA